MTKGKLIAILALSGIAIAFLGYAAVKSLVGIGDTVIEDGSAAITGIVDGMHDIQDVIGNHVPNIEDAAGDLKDAVGSLLTPSPSVTNPVSPSPTTPITPSPGAYLTGKKGTEIPHSLVWMTGDWTPFFTSLTQEDSEIICEHLYYEYADYDFTEPITCDAGSFLYREYTGTYVFSVSSGEYNRCFIEYDPVDKEVVSSDYFFHSGDCDVPFAWSKGLGSYPLVYWNETHKELLDYVEDKAQLFFDRVSTGAYPTFGDLIHFIPGLEAKDVQWGDIISSMQFEHFRTQYRCAELGPVRVRASHYIAPETADAEYVIVVLYVSAADGSGEEDIYRFSYFPSDGLIWYGDLNDYETYQ